MACSTQIVLESSQVRVECAACLVCARKVAVAFIVGFHSKSCRPPINKPAPLSRDYNRDQNSKALKSSGLINHVFTLYT